MTLIERFPSPGYRCAKHKDIGITYCNLCEVEALRAELERKEARIEILTKRLAKYEDKDG